MVSPFSVVAVSSSGAKRFAWRLWRKTFCGRGCEHGFWDGRFPEKVANEMIFAYVT